MNEPQPPIVITDKREQRRQEAARRAAAADHPSAPPAPAAKLTPEERTARIMDLQEAGHERGLSDQENDELLQLQAEELAELEAEREAVGDVQAARTAFLVIVGHDGSAVATSDVNMNLSIEHEANVDEMYAAVNIVKRDIDAAMVSKHVVFGMQVSAQAMQEKAMASRLMQQPGMPTGRRR